MRAKTIAAAAGGSLVVCSVSFQCMADDLAKYRTAMTQYFFSNHHAMPLFSNGSVQSGDVIVLPEEAKYLARDVCYKLGPAAPRLIDSAIMEVDREGAAAIGGSISIRTIADIEARVGGHIQSTSAIIVDPLSSETPNGGFSVLTQPRIIPECDVLRDVLAMGSQRYVLVTTVFHGAAAAQLGFSRGGNVDVTGDLDPALVKAIGDWIKVDLGKQASVTVKAAGANVLATFTKTPQPRSLAVQSAFLDPGELEYLFKRYQNSDRNHLRQLVRKFLVAFTSEAASLAKEMQAWLRDSGLWFGTAENLYERILPGKYPVAVTSDQQYPQDWWLALADVAAAHEMANATDQK